MMTTTTTMMIGTERDGKEAVLQCVGETSGCDSLSLGERGERRNKKKQPQV